MTTLTYFQGIFMITSVPYYHLCSLFAHLSRKGLEFENDFVVFNLFLPFFLNLWVKLYTSLRDWNSDWNISSKLGWFKQVGQIITRPIIRSCLKPSISWVSNEVGYHLSITTWRCWKKNSLGGPFPHASLRCGRWLILGFSKQRLTDAIIMYE